MATKRKVNVIHAMRVDEISTVDRGAGEGVKIVLTKREQNQHTVQKEQNTMSIEEVVRNLGVAKIAKAIVDDGTARGITEAELFMMASIESAKLRKAGETEAQAFSRYFQSAEAIDLRKAFEIAKAEASVIGYPSTATVEVTPVVVGGADATDVDNDGAKAIEELTRLADEMRARNPFLSEAQAFARVYSASENAELAQRERRANRPRVTA